jgi:glycosyltransferase involved in cell wall biosynthesis
MIKVFTPSYADEENTNAQNLTVKEIAARLDPQRFSVLMLADRSPDPRLETRRNTRFLHSMSHGNAIYIFFKILAFNPDVYFFPRAGPLDAVFFWMKRKLGWPARMVAYMVTGGLDTPNAAPVLLRNVAEADLVVGNNRYLSETLEKRTGVKVRTVYDGVDRRFFYPGRNQQHGESKPVVFCAGSFRAYKRLDVVVREAAAHPEAEFRIAGTGEEEVACRRLAAELNCGNVHFLGHLPQAELGEQMRRADIFLFPSVLEGHPQVLAQAAASGLPCIAMEGYHPDYVVHGKTGFLEATHEGMGNRLSELLVNRELRKAMSKAAIEHAAQFEWDQIAQQWQDVFEEVAGQRRSG